MASLAVIATKLDDLKQNVLDLKQNIDVQFSEVKEKQDRTNGRVRRLESWRAWMLGFSVCLSIIVIPLIVYVWETHVAQNMTAEAKMQK